MSRLAKANTATGREELPEQVWQLQQVPGRYGARCVRCGDWADGGNYSYTTLAEMSEQIGPFSLWRTAESSEVFSVAFLVFVLGGDEGGLDDLADASGALGDAVQGFPAGGDQGGGAFAEAA